VVEALEQDVARLGVLPAGCEALVASAFALARELDGDNRASAKANCSKALLETIGQLRELAPLQAQGSPLDQIRDRRDKRLRRAS
jgi:hypothetical protein